MRDFFISRLLIFHTFEVILLAMKKTTILLAFALAAAFFTNAQYLKITLRNDTATLNGDTVKVFGNSTNEML